MTKTPDMGFDALLSYSEDGRHEIRFRDVNKASARRGAQAQCYIQYLSIHNSTREDSSNRECDAFESASRTMGNVEKGDGAYKKIIA